MKFLLDACVSSNDLRQALSSLGHDVLTAPSIGPGIADEDLLERALREERILVTADTDFGKLIFAMGLPHGTVIRFEELDVTGQCRAIRGILSNRRADLESSSLVVLSPGRIRIRRQ